MTEEPQLTARALLRKIRRDGGRVFRMPEVAVFVLTDKPLLAQWLLELGGKGYTPHGDDKKDRTPGGFERTPGGKREYDIYIHTIPVKGEQTIWEAAVKDEPYEIEAA